MDGALSWQSLPVQPLRPDAATETINAVRITAHTRLYRRQVLAFPKLLSVDRFINLSMQVSCGQNRS